MRERLASVVRPLALPIFVGKMDHADVLVADDFLVVTRKSRHEEGRLVPIYELDLHLTRLVM